jgi:hypothetical protein
LLRDLFARLLHPGDIVEREAGLWLRDQLGEDPAGPEEVAERVRHLVPLPGFMCDKDLWTDMVPDMQKLGTIH